VVHHAEEDTAYWQTMPSLSGEDRWFWGTRISPNTSGMPSGRDYTVRLGKISTVATNAVVRVRLKGYTGLAHRTQLRLNGQVIDEQSWQGQIQYTHEVTLPSTLLRDGDNVVRVTTLNSGASVDQLLVNWMEIEYAAGYNAEDNHLAFGTPDPGQQRLVVDGFGAPAIAVFDVTDVAAPARILNTLIEGASAGSVAFSMSRGGRYEA
jgi:hypothetical protein